MTGKKSCLTSFKHCCKDNPLYAGFIVPPAPPRPDFDASREKLQKLGEAESGQLTKDEFNKMKQELEAEYLATFKAIFGSLLKETFNARFSNNTYLYISLMILVHFSIIFLT